MSMNVQNGDAHGAMTVHPHGRPRLRRAAVLLRRDLEDGQAENEVQAAMLAHFIEEALADDEPAQLAVEVLEREVLAVFARFECQ